jgi:hypothetical protein
MKKLLTVWIFCATLLFSYGQSTNLEMQVKSSSPALVVNSEQKWLNAAQGMLSVNDPAISSTNLEHIKTLIGWAVTNGYSVTVSEVDPVRGTNRGMYFAVVKKINF